MSRKNVLCILLTDTRVCVGTAVLRVGVVQTAGAASAQLPAVTTLTQTVAIRPAGVCRVCVQPSTLYSCTLHWHSSEQHRTLLNSHCFVALIVTLFCKAKCYLTNFCDI